MPLPLYMLARLGLPGGLRLPKRPAPVDKVAGSCETCGKPVTRIMLHGMEQLNGIYRSGGEYFHYQCVPYTPPYREAVYTSAASSIVENGNLETEEYRYWIGTREAKRGNVGWAMCRCCRTTFWTKVERAKHYDDLAFRHYGDACSTRLVKAYAELLSDSKCLVCKKMRFGHKKWGVPICEQPECHRRFKFGHDRWIELEQMLDKQRKALDLEALAKAKATSKAYIDTCGEKLTERVWCASCEMFADNLGHDEVHALLEPN